MQDSQLGRKMKSSWGSLKQRMGGAPGAADKQQFRGPLPGLDEQESPTSQQARSCTVCWNPQQERVCHCSLG